MVEAIERGVTFSRLAFRSQHELSSIFYTNLVDCGELDDGLPNPAESKARNPVGELG